MKTMDLDLDRTLMNLNDAPDYKTNVTDLVALRASRLASVEPLPGARQCNNDTDTDPNVPFPHHDLFPLVAPPKDLAFFGLSVAASIFARLEEAPTLTCARQVASPIDAAPACCACRRASNPEPVTG